MATKARSAGAQHERRRGPRAARLGRAMVSFNETWGHEYELANVSAGGALLMGGPQLRCGRRVRVMLELIDLPPIAVAARVVRDVCDGMLAVRFIDLEAAHEDMIQDAVLCALSGHSWGERPMEEEAHAALPSDDVQPPEEIVPTSWPGFGLPRTAQ